MDVLVGREQSDSCRSRSFVNEVLYGILRRGKAMFHVHGN